MVVYFSCFSMCFAGGLAFVGQGEMMGTFSGKHTLSSAIVF